MSIKLLRVETDCCHECNKHGPGVRFRLFGDRNNVSFLCWEHFRLNTDILLESGILWRHPREPLMFTVYQPLTPRSPEGRDGAWPRTTTHTEGYSTSAATGRSEGEPVSRTQTEGTGCKDCGRQHQTATDSESWSQTEGHSDPM